MSRKLAIAALLAAACSSLDLDKLEPKQAGECAAGTKPCGYLCVPKDDPASGCGGASCAPCAVGPNEVGVCDTSGATPTCARECANGYADCVGTVAGCETRLADDRDNCGVCGRACFAGDACTSAVCPPVSADVPRAAVNPRDVDAIPGTGEILYVDGAAGGELWSTTQATARASGLGDVRRLDADAGAAFVTGTVDEGSVRYDVVYQVNAGGVTSPLELTRWDRAGASAPVLLDLTATSTDLWFTVAGNTQLFRAIRGTTGQHGGEDLGELALSVTSAGGTELFVGTEDATSGRVRGYDPTTEKVGRAFPALGRSVDRVAYEAGRQILFAASFADGSVWWYDALDATGTPIMLWRTGQPTASMDLHADADGVYWTDLTAGLVMGLRYDTNPAAWILYWYGGRPTGVTALGSSVYWTDLDGGVFEAPK